MILTTGVLKIQQIPKLSLNPSHTAAVGSQCNGFIMKVFETVSCVIITLFQVLLVLVLEALLFIAMLGGGLIFGKTVVDGVYAFLGTPQIVSGQTRMFREVYWGFAGIVFIFLGIVIPFQKHYMKPALDFIFKTYRTGATTILCIIEACLLGLCLAEINILFEMKYCKMDFHSDNLNGPINGFLALTDMDGKFKFGYYPDKEQLDKVLSFLLVVGFTYPLYDLWRCYLAGKSSRFNMDLFAEKVLTTNRCFCQDNSVQYHIDVLAQVSGLIFELLQLTLLYVPIFTAIQIIPLLDESLRPGFASVGLGIFCFLFVWMLILTEQRFPKAFMRGKNGVETRILLNQCILVFFATKTFAIFFEPISAEYLCFSGYIRMTSEISKSFVFYFIIVLSSAWKIIYISISYSGTTKWFDRNCLLTINNREVAIQLELYNKPRNLKGEPTKVESEN